MEINVHKIMVKPTLWLTKFFRDEKAVLVCKGYGDDWELFTGLYWGEDRDMIVRDYSDYQLWIGTK